MYACENGMCLQLKKKVVFLLYIHTHSLTYIHTYRLGPKILGLSQPAKLRLRCCSCYACVHIPMHTYIHTYM